MEEEEGAIDLSSLLDVATMSEQEEPHSAKNSKVSDKVDDECAEVPNGEIVTEEQQTTLVAAASPHDILEQTGSDQTIDESFIAQSSVFEENAVDPAQGSEKIYNEVFDSAPLSVADNSSAMLHAQGDNLTMSDVDDTCYSSDSALNAVGGDFVMAEISGRNQYSTEPASGQAPRVMTEPGIDFTADNFKQDSFEGDSITVSAEKMESSEAFLHSFPFAEHDEADQPSQNDEVATPHENPRITVGAVSTDSGDHDGLDTFDHSTPASVKWMEPTGASLKIEVEDERVAVHVPFTPKKSPYTPSSFKGAPSFDSNTATPLARVLPLISSPPHSAPHSSRHQSNARNSPDPVHFPDIHNTRMSFAQSSKLTASRPASVDPSTTSRSQSMKASFSAGASFSQPEAPSSPKGSPLFNLDATLSPTAKFRSFIKSIQSGKSGMEEESDVSMDTFGVAGSSKIASGNSAKEVNARIAKIQAEQERFRMTEKLRKSMLGIGRRISFENSNTNSSSDLTGKRLPVKTQKKGVAQNFNANSIRAGLRRHEFRETIEIGNEIVKRKVLPQDPEPQNAQLQKAYQNLEHVQDGEKKEESHEKVHHDAPFGLRLAHLYKPAPVTRTGEGYMSEADWKITVKGRHRSPKKASKRGSSQMSAKEGLALQRANAANAASNLDLVQFVESTLKEQTAQIEDSADDCPGEPDVPLCYLQSAHLIDRRFGWESKDHSMVQHDLPKLKSWVTLRGIVQSTGAFHLIAAAAAPPITENSQAGRNKLMEPLPNAPVIVQEATPVTEFVANVLRSQPPRAASPDSVEHHAKTPHFSIAKQIPRRIDPDHKDSSSALNLKALTKEEAKSVKIKAITKEFHDRYNGLIFHDSYRDLTWHDTEDMILGTVRPKKNDLLLTRSDMRWAGKTLNLFRPWSAAREVDVIDKFRLKRDNTSTSLTSKPGSPKKLSPPGSPNPVEWYRGMEGSVNGESSIGSLGSHGGSISTMGDRPSGAHGMRNINTHHSLKNHHKHATHPSPAGSVGGHSRSRGGQSHASPASQYTRNSHSPANSRQGALSPPKLIATHGGASVGSLNTHHNSAHSAARSGAVSHNNNHHASIPSMVTFAAGTQPFDQSDNASAYTLTSNNHGSKASHHKRPPLLINLVKPLPPATRSHSKA